MVRDIDLIHIEFSHKEGPIPYLVIMSLFRTNIGITTHYINVLCCSVWIVCPNAPVRVVGCNSGQVFIPDQVRHFRCRQLAQRWR